MAWLEQTSGWRQAYHKVGFGTKTGQDATLAVRGAAAEIAMTMMLIMDADGEDHDLDDVGDDDNAGNINESDDCDTDDDADDDDGLST